MTFRHRAGVRPYTSSCDLAESCVFGKQSLPLFLCNPVSSLERMAHHSPGYTFSRSYSANLPSSLTRGLSSALEFSSGPPVSVCGTSINNNHVRGFSWKRSIGELSSCTLSSSHLGNTGKRLSLSRPIFPSYLLEPVTIHPAHLTFSVPTDVQAHH